MSRQDVVKAIEDAMEADDWPEPTEMCFCGSPLPDDPVEWEVPMAHPDHDEIAGVNRYCTEGCMEDHKQEIIRGDA